MTHELLPPWASSRATGGYTDLMASLPTKDGRLTGNAVIVWRGTRYGIDVTQVVTDAGNSLYLTDNELVELFHPPVYVMASLLPAHREALSALAALN